MVNGKRGVRPVRWTIEASAIGKITSTWQVIDVRVRRTCQVRINPLLMQVPMAHLTGLR